MARWNEDGFTALLTPHLDRLYRLAYRLAGARADAEDLVQDVLTKLFDRRADLSSISDLAPYLGRVLYNQFIDDRRRYGRMPIKLVGAPDVDLVPERASRGPEQQAAAAEIDQRVKQALARLSEEQRIVVLLADSEGYQLPEIEVLTGIALGTLKSRLHRGRARLREILVADGTFRSDPSFKSVEGAKSDVL
ncbi:MAG: RNA polymerase sigma factor [Gammaproteobacteria bacterium]|nr:RNA polymerase sigma factor [Gammaproteobacteria bacterium]